MINAGVLLLTGAGLGLTYAAAPGAVNTEALRRGVARGARSTLLIEAGSLIGDGLWAALALTGVVLIGQHRAILVALGIAGGCFLLRMAWLALHDAWVGAKPPATSAAARGDFATGAFFGLANPVGLAFWSGLGSGVAAEASGVGIALFFAGFYIGAILWCLGITTLIGWGRRWVRPNLFRWINALCGLALGYFGARLLWTSLEDLWLARARGLRALWSARAG
ncbi:MAG TPA: LysE family transporter [Ktedonobacterales bacterium]|jgi:threonine/homoserine/homoserine lactone efflux protein